jgi:multiple sugar transport system substrate-binding protein
MATGFTDLLNNVIRKGADPAGELTKLDKTVNTELARLFG